eukprot:Skav216306  [mRNA]  locus=scaffold494:194261:194698:+ [translate_table: standard]
MTRASEVGSPLKLILVLVELVTCTAFCCSASAIRLGTALRKLKSRVSCKTKSGISRKTLTRKEYPRR